MNEDKFKEDFIMFIEILADIIDDQHKKMAKQLIKDIKNWHANHCDKPQGKVFDSCEKTFIRTTEKALVAYMSIKKGNGGNNVTVFYL
jgi:hypothetical protein